MPLFCTPAECYDLQGRVSKYSESDAGRENAEQKTLLSEHL